MRKFLAVFIISGVIMSQNAVAYNPVIDVSCAGAITRAFFKLQKEFETTMALTNLQMTSSVIPSAEANIPKIKTENAVLRKLIATQQAINLQQEELNFHLEKKIHLRN